MKALRWPGHQHKSKEARRPKYVKLRSSKWFITSVVSFANATDFFMYGLIVPVTPTALQSRVGLSEHDVQAWTSTTLALFGGALFAVSPIVGYIADRTKSRRWPYLCGLALLTAATALLCAGTHIGFWIVGRLFQGAASAVVWIVGNALLADTVGKDGITESLGYVSMTTSFAQLAGPLLGGVVYEHGGYYAVFGVAFGLIGLDTILRCMVVERKYALNWLECERGLQEVERNAPEPPTIDKTGVQTTGSPQGPKLSSNSPVMQASRPSRSRIMILLTSPRVIVACWGTFIISIIITSFDSVLPLFVHDTFEWKQSGQGLIFIPLAIPQALSPVTGSILDKHPQASRFMAAGALFSCVPVLVLLRLVTDNSIQHKVVLCTLLSFVGVCIAIALPPLDAEVFHAVNEKERQTPDIFGKGGAVALAFGLTNMGFAAGSLAGPFLAGFIRQQAGWETMSWVLGLIAGVSSLPILLYVGGWIPKSPPSLSRRD